MGNENPIRALGDYSIPSHEGYQNTIELPDKNNVVHLRTINQSGGGKLRDKNAKESCALLEDLTLYDNESWNDPRDFAKPVKAISLTQDVPSTSDHHLIELENLVQRLMEAHLAPKSYVQVNKIASSSDLGSCVNLISLYLFKNLKIGLLEETDHVFGLADGTKSYPIGIVKSVEVHIGKLKLLEDFYVIDMEKDPATLLLVGRGFLATASAVIDCKKAKIAVGEGATRLIFRVKEIDLGDEEVPYWTTLEKRESYTPRPSTYEIGTRPPYYAKKDFIDYHLPREWQIVRDFKLNPFKDVLVFRKMVEFLGAIPINLKRNMWELEELIEERIDWNRPPKERDGA
ncbi:MAK10-like protein [Tanacetum coccineum]